MSKYAERLNLDSENLELLSDVYKGYANVLIKNESISGSPYIASCFTIAGTYKALLNKEDCKDCFQKASQYYKQAENDYWIICSLCSTTINSNGNKSNRTEELSFEKLESLYLEKILDSKREIDSNNRNSKLTGRLLIPQRIYLDAIREINRLNDNDLRKSTFTNCTRLFNRSAEYIHNLMEDSYHWNTMYGNFIPIEPESLAISMIVLNKLKNKKINLNQFLERTEIGYLSKIPLELANEMNK